MARSFNGRVATLAYLRRLFVESGLGEPAVRMFHVTYSATVLSDRLEFPKGNDRAGLLALIENSVEGGIPSEWRRGVLRTGCG